MATKYSPIEWVEEVAAVHAIGIQISTGYTGNLIGYQSPKFIDD